MLGIAYQHGFGVDKDLVEAHKWLNIAASLGDEEAPAMRDKLTNELSQEGLQRAQRLAVAWAPKRGDKEALTDFLDEALLEVNRDLDLLAIEELLRRGPTEKPDSKP